MPRTEHSKVHNWFVGIDFDRTIGDTERLYALFEHILEHHTHLTAQQVAYEKQQIESSRGSFDVISHVKSIVLENLGTDAWQTIKNEFLAAAQADGKMLLPGAQDLLKLLKENAIPSGILTYGGVEWQTLKLQASGVSLPWHITSTPHKAELIAGWRQENGLFLPPSELMQPGELARFILLLDDKTAAFKNMPIGMNGILVGDAEIPAGVQRARNLHAALGLTANMLALAA